jgi:hypothetical protein
MAIPTNLDVGIVKTMSPRDAGRLGKPFAPAAPAITIQE